MVSASRRKKQNEDKKARVRKRAEKERANSTNNQQHEAEKTRNDIVSQPFSVFKGLPEPYGINPSVSSFPVHPVPLAEKMKPFNTTKAAEALIKYYRESKFNPSVPNETIPPGYVFMSIANVNKMRTEAELKQIEKEMLSIIAARDPELEEELKRYIAERDVLQHIAPKDETKDKDSTLSSERSFTRKSDGNNTSKTKQDDSAPQKLTAEPKKKLTRIEQAILSVKTTTPAMQELQKKLEAKRDGLQDSTLNAQSHDQDKTSSGNSSDDDSSVEGNSGKFHDGKPKAESMDKDEDDTSFGSTSEEESEGERFDGETRPKNAVGAPITGSKKSDVGSAKAEAPDRKHALKSKQQTGFIKRQRIEINGLNHILEASDIAAPPQKMDTRAAYSTSPANDETSSARDLDDDTSSEGTVVTPDTTPAVPRSTPAKSTVASKKQAFTYTNNIATHYDKDGTVSFPQKVESRQANTSDDDEADTIEAARILGIPDWFPFKIKDILISLSWGSEEDSLPWKFMTYLSKYRAYLEAIRFRRWKRYIRAGSSRHNLSEIIRKLRASSFSTTRTFYQHRVKQHQYWKERAMKAIKTLERVTKGIKVLDEAMEEVLGEERKVYEKYLD